jgi:hypothetical protein
MRTISLGTMIKQIAALAGTKDVSEWEDQFIESVVGFSGNGEDTRAITDKQIAVIERIHRKHFS